LSAQKKMLWQSGFRS